MHGKESDDVTRRPDVLYHFTCVDHGLTPIRRTMKLRPNRFHPLTPTPLIWLTTNHEPVADDLGLTHEFTTCDRSAVRCTVTDTRRCLSWHEYIMKRGLPVGVRDLLEASRDYSTWWVCERELPVDSIEVLP